MGKIILPTQPDKNKYSCDNLHPADIIKNITHSDLKGTKITFINMDLRVDAWPPQTTPEGPLLMMTRLRNEYGVEANIVDLNGYRKENPETLWDKLGQYRYYNEREIFQHFSDHFLFYGEPDVVAFSGMITTLQRQELAARIIRKILPKVFLISGGGLATDLESGLFNYIPELDAIARSEGDDIIIKIMYDAKIIKERGWQNAISSGSLKPYYVGELHNKPRLVYEGARPRSLDDLPFADLDFLTSDVYGTSVLQIYLQSPVWGGLNPKNSSAAPFSMNRSTTSVSTRGCPHACTYCDRTATGGRLWGTISPENLMRLLQINIERYGIDFHGWVDDNMPIDRNRIAQMVPLIQPLGINWGTHGRMDEISGLKPSTKTREVPLRLENMAKSGCKYVGAGPESASPRILEVIGKGGHMLMNGLETVKVAGENCEFPVSMTEAVRTALEFGIHINCTWIMLSPTETLEDLKKTIRFIKFHEEYYAAHRVPAGAVNKKMFTMTYYPGTTLIQQPKVRTELAKAFGLSFDPKTNKPIFNENFHRYCLQLDDATKLLFGPNGEPVNFSAIPNDLAIRAREYVDSNQTYKILDMND